MVRHNKVLDLYVFVCRWNLQVTLYLLMQVWDAATGRKQYTFEGHEAPVYSVCPHHKESIQVQPTTT